MNATAPSTTSPLKFSLLVLALSLPFWLLGAVAQRWSELIPVNLPVSALMAFCPLMAALILVYREGRAEGIKRLMKRVWDPTGIKPKIWYVPILLTMPVISLLSYGTMRWMERPLPEPRMPLLAMPVFFVVYLTSAIGEEAGWMPFVVHPLQERWGALQASLVMGLGWGIWHAVPYLQAQNSLAWIMGQCFFSVAVRVLMSWVSNNTGRSVLAAVLFHTMINVSWSLFPNYGSHYDPAVTGVITAIAAVIVTLVWGPKTLAR